MEKPHVHATRPTENLPAREKIILVIDDCPDFLEVAKSILEIGNYMVFTATSAEDAFSILSKIAQPDLILLDMQMSDMSGQAFLTALEETNPETLKNVPVVFLSANERAPASKAAGFIRKPVDIDKLLTAVLRFIEGRADHHVNQH